MALATSYYDDSLTCANGPVSFPIFKNSKHGPPNLFSFFLFSLFFLAFTHFIGSLSVKVVASESGIGRGQVRRRRFYSFSKNFLKTRPFNFSGVTWLRRIGVESMSIEPTVSYWALILVPRMKRQYVR